MSGRLSKTDSDASSLTQSSPNRSPRRPAYYVQSPSRDSHDGEKTTNSFHSTPAVLSPMGSPPHSHSNSSLGPHSSRESSSTRLSGSLKPQRKSSNDQVDGGGRGGKGGKGTKGKMWRKEFDAIEEEGLLDSDGIRSGLSTRSRPQKPTIAIKSILFDQFVVQAGADYSGVATEMVSMNCSVKFTFRNTATFFDEEILPIEKESTFSDNNNEGKPHSIIWRRVRFKQHKWSPNPNRTIEVKLHSEIKSICIRKVGEAQVL
ncbi:hypothetical protein ACFE04_022222 [Oxalis oulophora]